MKLEPPRPCGWIPDIGSGLCAPIYGEGIIPPRHPVPGRLKGEPITVTDEALAHGVVSSLVALVNEKLRLEDERMRRLLPDLPAGFSWRGEIQSHEHIDFQSLEGSTTIRIVYRLYGPDGQKVEE